MGRMKGHTGVGHNDMMCWGGGVRGGENEGE